MRFSLQSILLSFVLVWSCLAAFGTGGILLCVTLLSITAYARSPHWIERRLEPVLIRAILIVLIFVTLGTILPVFGPSVPHERSVHGCASNMKYLALALHAYHDDHGSFPPAYIADSEGKPMHSWRVLILPYLECQQLYDAYDSDEPWDGPNNRTLTKRMPEFFCRSDKKADDNDTSYLAVVGPNAAWLGKSPRTRGDFGDSASSTIMLVEIHNSGIHWMEPRDISLEELRRAVYSKKDEGTLRRHSRDNGYFCHDDSGVNVVLADVSVRFLSEDTPPATIDALLRADPEKSIDLDVLDALHLRWDRIVALAAMVGSFLLLVFRPRRSGE